jgi:catechol 2,3-dioxygenase-like lactoylglutathione lyase family enzyme
MIGYVTLGTNDIQRGASFYDEVLGVLGASRAMDHEGYIAWNTGPGQPMVSIIKPYNKEAASVGNGGMLALAAGSQAKVDEIYAKAIELGGEDEGAPGIRGGAFYIAYFRDLDGNKISAFHVGE